MLIEDPVPLNLQGIHSMVSLFTAVTCNRTQCTTSIFKA